MTSKSKYHPIDIHVGKQLRKARLELQIKNLSVGKDSKVTLQSIADKLDITQQQLSKYEKGEGRICASRLYQLAQILKVSVSYFFRGYKSKTSSTLVESALNINS